LTQLNLNTDSRYGVGSLFVTGQRELLNSLVPITTFLGKGLCGGEGQKAAIRNQWAAIAKKVLFFDVANSIDGRRPHQLRAIKLGWQWIAQGLQSSAERTGLAGGNDQFVRSSEFRTVEETSGAMPSAQIAKTMLEIFNYPG
jgi:hypothetical protein